MSWRFRRGRDHELDREIRDHIELDAELQQRVGGAGPEEAAYLARRRFGNVGMVKEAVREAWGLHHWDVIRQDVRYALRGLRRSPAFTMTAVISLALGIGANTAVFSLVNALLLRELPVREPEKLVQVTVIDSGNPRTTFSYVAIRGLRELASKTVSLCGFSLDENVEIGAAGSDHQARAVWMTGGCHRALGAPLARGRGLSEADDRPEGGTDGVVAVVSYDYWTRELGSTDAVIGSKLAIEGTVATIIGVTGPGFAGPNVGHVADVTLPVSAMPVIRPNAPRILSPNMNWLRLFARLEPDVNQAEAGARLTVAWRRVVAGLIEQGARGLPTSGQVTLASGSTGWSDLRSRFTQPLVVLMGIVVLVLLVACANLAALLLARASARRREFALRLAMGAGRSRLVRQVLSESMMIAALGGVAGLLVASVCSRVIVQMLSIGRPRPIDLDIRMDAAVLLFAFAAALATSILFGLGPAIRATSVPERSALGQATRSRSTRRERSASALVILQTALSLVLVVSAGLFGRTLRNLVSAEYGFRQDQVTLVSVEIPRLVKDGPNQASIAQLVLQDVASLPGVRGASISGSPPSSGSGWTMTVTAWGATERDKREAEMLSVSADYFRVFDIAVRSGRPFDRTDAMGSPQVAIVNEAFVREWFATSSALGQRVTLGGSSQPVEIVGVVENVAAGGPRRPATPALYRPFFQMPNAQLSGGASIALQTEPAGISAEIIRKRIQERVSGASVTVRPFKDLIAAQLGNERMLAVLATCFGVMALFLSGVGLYGLLAFGVQTRTTEIGVRTALGATRASVIWLIMSEALALVGIGILIGVPGVVAGKRFLTGMMFGLSVTDPTTLGLAIVAIAATALAAGCMPALRATAISPIRALKSE